MMESNQQCEVASINAAADAMELAQPDFFCGASGSVYYRQAESGRVFQIQLDLAELSEARLDSAEVADGGMDAAEDLGQLVSLRRGMVITEETDDPADVIASAQPFDLKALRADGAAWLVAAADAIDEADGVPEDVMPPSSLH